MICTVTNFHTEEFDVYIGRAGRGWKGTFGNPFNRKLGEKRGATLERFEAYFLHRVEADPEFNSQCLGLAGQRLGCPGHCKPETCHGTIIARWVNEAMKNAEWLTCANRGAGCDEAWMGLAKDHVCNWCKGGPYCGTCSSIRNHEPCAGRFYP